MNRLARNSLFVFSIVFTIGGVLACSETPFAAGNAGSSVRFALAGVKTSAGVFVCAEADLAELTIAPAGDPTRVLDRQVGTSGGCTVDFSVTVPKGPVRFTGELLGRGRPLMRGSPPSFEAEDGFVVHIDLTEIDALDVQTRTIGLGGPATYMFQVDGSADLIPIGQEDADTLGALAGGPRFVTLYPEPCVVVNGPAHREAMIPVDERQLGATMFEVDCNQGGNVHVITETQGGGGPTDYTVFVGDMPPEQVGSRDSVMIVDVTPGPLDVKLVTGDPHCSVIDVTPPEHFLPSGGDHVVKFIIRCVAGGNPTQYEAIRVVTQAVQAPLPGEIQTFDAVVTDAAGNVQTLAIALTDSVTFFFPTPASNPHAVSLIATGTCTVRNGPSTQSVNASGAGGARVLFWTGC